MGSVPRIGRSPVAAPVLAGCCLAAGAVYVTAQDPAAGGVFAPCPFRLVTGWWCPGCGLTRATHHLFRGDVGQALRFNVFVLAVLVAFGTMWLAWVARALGRPALRRLRPSPWLYASVTALLLLFAVARNLPGITGLRG